MEMEPQERESDVGDESPVSQIEEELSEGDGESGRDHEDSCEELRRHGGNALISDHDDVLAKLKMQVRDIKEDFENGRHMNFVLPPRALSMPENFHLPPYAFQHPTPPFIPPSLLPPPPAPSSGSSHSSEGSACSQQTWSFEEQFKQVRQLYEINDDPRRKEFLDDLFSFMQKRGTPINRLPIMAKSVLDLFELYNLVIARGGLVDVINKKLWQEIIKGLHLPSSITSAAFTLRTQYMKYLYPYECDKRHLSTPAELQAAIDGNRREGRRSSYGQYDGIQRSPTAAQMSPMTLVSQAQQQHLAARMSSVMASGMALHNGAHHPSHPPPLAQHLNGGPVPNLAPSEFEARMLEYVKLLNKEIRSSTATPPVQGEASPPNAISPLNHLEMSRMTLWNLYNNNATPVEPQKEALNLADAVSTQTSLKREHPENRVHQENREHQENRDSPPPAKKFPRQKDDPEDISASSTHIRINSRGDSRNGESSLVVSMDLNGTTFQGVLFAQPPPSSGRAEEPS